MPAIAIVLLIVTTLLAGPAYAAKADVPGSADEPAIGRFTDSVISGYYKKDFEEYVFHVGPVRSGVDNTESLEGAIRHIAYTTPEVASIAEVYRNYKNKLNDAGYKILFECETKACGGGDFRYAIKLLPIPRMEVDTFRYRYMAARKELGGVVNSVAVIVSIDTKKQIRSQVTLLESGALENKMVAAEAMAESLHGEGHIALYGIHFDTGKTGIKPESKPTLDEIGKLLTTSPALRIILVGHTDNQGGFEYNMDLSLRRAKSVANTLITEYGIKQERLRAAGVGYLAPVATNDNDPGRALNRRVELVKDK